MDAIVVRGAREHNLRNISVSIPRDRLTVITGLSGSGKSSLAFDTIYAEGQRRYVESLSAYARQFLQQNQKPDVDGIDGLSPAISIEQRSISRNPRSTVGTLTEVYDYLRLLYARLGEPHCPECGRPIVAQTVQQMVDTVLGWPEGTRLHVLCPLVKGRKGEHRKLFEQARKDGFVRVRVDGVIRMLDEEITLDKKKAHHLDVVVDRLVLKPTVRNRLTDSLELALNKGEGYAIVAPVEGEDVLFSEHFSCEHCHVSIPELEPRLFSFNSPHGACEACGGLGFALDLDLGKVVPDHALSLEDGAIAPWGKRWAGFYQAQLRSVAKHYGAKETTPWKKLPKKFRTVVLEGSGEEAIRFRYERDEHRFDFRRPFEGVLPSLRRRHKESQSEKSREDIQLYMTERPCKDCEGLRLRPAALAVTVGGVGISDLCSRSASAATQTLSAMEWTDQQRSIGERILGEIFARLGFLESVGVGYLTLDRRAGTLSGGEGQRIRLATQIGSALQGVIYVLDEPSIGLHQKDNDRLLQTLLGLRDLGNTVLVVEHDEDTIRAADHIIDMGPGAGVHGGTVVASGSLEEIIAHSTSLTGAYLSRSLKIAVPSERRKHKGTLRLSKARGNNLKSVSVDVPLGCFVCVTGVSGSGKSTLVNDTLYQELARHLGLKSEAAPSDGLTGADDIEKVINIDQTPIGRTPRSNPATYTQVFSVIRDLFAGLPESRARGYRSGRYSFNVKGGRCESCRGDGLLRIEMHFLPDVYVECDQCKGRRYNRETLEVRYRGKSIADVLDMTVEEGLAFFDPVPSIKRKLSTLQAVGLSYVQLGQSATTLSGGEAQRIKLSRELSRRAPGKTLYILDEPTTGLHFADVERLLSVLHELVESGSTVVVIEHHLDVIKTADHVIDLGPDGGDAGGEIIASGTPEQVAKNPRSYTGQYLAPLL